VGAVKTKADRPYAAWRAKKVIAQLKLEKPPVLPIQIAEDQGIFVQSSDRLQTGCSGCLMKQGDTFGILYTNRLDNKGFIHFTVAHELGHYFLESHQKAFFSSGSRVHYSQSGFVSYDRYEVEADHFAAAFLMPEVMFTEALGRTGEGLEELQALAESFCTSLTATAIRYAELSPNPVVIVVSEGDHICYALASASIRDLDKVWMPEKGALLPPQSVTARFNRNPDNIQKARKSEGYSQLDDWIDETPAVEVKEDVIGLGGYGRTLTVLFADELPDPEDEDSDDEER